MWINLTCHVFHRGINMKEHRLEWETSEISPVLLSVIHMLNHRYFTLEFTQGSGRTNWRCRWSKNQVQKQVLGFKSTEQFWGGWLRGRYRQQGQKQEHENRNMGGSAGNHQGRCRWLTRWKWPGSLPGGSCGEGRGWADVRRSTQGLPDWWVFCLRAHPRSTTRPRSVQAVTLWFPAAFWYTLQWERRHHWTHTSGTVSV